MSRARKQFAKPTQWGRLVADERPGSLPPELRDASIQAVKWLPNRRGNKQVPPGFELRLLIVQDEQGQRRIVPRAGDQEFLILASAAGMGIIFNSQKPPAGVKETYRLMQLVFQASFNRRRMMGRRIKRLEDLSLTRSERRGASERDLLPEITLPKSASRLTPKRVAQLGREMLEENGGTRVDGAMKLEAGLLEAARRLNCSFEPDRAAALLRVALFGTETEMRPADSAIELIEGRLFDAVRKHRLCPPAEFRKFFWGDVDNLIQQIAKRRKRSEGEPPVERDTARYVLNDLLWRSFMYVSQCVAMQMQAVRLAMFPDLNPEERRIYSHRYELRPELGGLVSATLNSRLGFACLTWDRLAASTAPDEPQHWNAFLQTLDWHNQIVTNRRKIDGIQKAKRQKKISPSAAAPIFQATSESRPSFHEFRRQQELIDDEIDRSW